MAITRQLIGLAISLLDDPAPPLYATMPNGSIYFAGRIESAAFSEIV
jgi:hypothetical protein